MKITANMVTLSRLFLIPVPFAGMIFGDAYIRWICFAVLALLGMTDWVDGMLARKYGPTKLGGLLDPVADKVFVAAAFLVVAGVGWFPAWFVALILFREFIIGGLRTAVAMRGETVTTSDWAKIKTEWQMVGVGVIFLLRMLSPAGQDVAILILWAFFAGASLIIKFILRRALPHWAMPAVYGVSVVTFIQLIWGASVTIPVAMAMIFGITWFSAANYMKLSRKVFREMGMELGDWVRIYWAISFSLAALFVSGEPVIALPLLICLGFEFMLSGVDNVIAAEKEEWLDWPFIATGSFALLFSIISFLEIEVVLVTSSVYAAVLAVGSAVVFTVVMVKWGKLFKKALDFTEN